MKFDPACWGVVAQGDQHYCPANLEVKLEKPGRLYVGEEATGHKALVGHGTEFKVELPRSGLYFFELADSDGYLKHPLPTQVRPSEDRPVLTNEDKRGEIDKSTAAAILDERRTNQARKVKAQEQRRETVKLRLERGEELDEDGKPVVKSEDDVTSSDDKKKDDKDDKTPAEKSEDKKPEDKVDDDKSQE